MDDDGRVRQEAASDERNRVHEGVIDQVLVLAQGGPGWMAGALAALGVAIMTTTMLRGLVKRRQRAARSAPGGDAPPIVTAPKAAARSPEALAHSAQRASLERLMVEVQELTRVCAAQIENRAQRLELLIAQADDRLARLAAQQSSAQAVAEVVTHPTAPVSRPIAKPQTAEAPTPARKGQSIDARTHIRALHAQGKSSAEIARLTGEPIGKVELVIALQSAERAIAASAARG